MSIAERALAAYGSDQEAQKLLQAGELLRQHGIAVGRITKAGEDLGLIVDPGSVVQTDAWSKFTWHADVTVDEDVVLRIMTLNVDHKIKMTVKVPDQLYWNLPPGQTKKEPGGGTYACYGLDSSLLNKSIESLADLGGAITQVRRARESWRKKHQP